MLIFFLVATNLVYLGVILFLLWEGFRIGVLGGGYRLVGGRESFGWGARTAGFMLMAPLPLTILAWALILSSGRVTMEAVQRGDHNAITLALTAVIVIGCFALSYLFAEVTNMPYWLYL